MKLEYHFTEMTDSAESMVGSEARAFWDFTLEIYRDPGLRRSLLDLQDAHGADVNIVLYAVFLGAVKAERVEAAGWRRIADHVAAWRSEVVEPLRATRRRLKSMRASDEDDAAYQAALAAELAAERSLQRRIVETPGLHRGASQTAGSAVAENCRNYLIDVIAVDAAAVATALTDIRLALEARGTPLRS